MATKDGSTGRKKPTAPEDTQVKEYKGKSYGKRLLSKDVQETISQLEAQAAEAQSKAKKRGRWGNIGAFVGSIALGAVTGGASLLAQSAAAGAGAYAGSRAGRGAADMTEKTKLGKMGKLKGNLMRKSKESQAASFRDVLKGQEKSAQAGALVASAGAFMAGGGGKYIGKGLEKVGVSKDVLEKTKIFSTSGAGDVRPLYGDKTPGFEPPVSSSVTIPGKPAVNMQSNPFSGAGDIKQASLAEAGNPNLATTASKTDTAYTGTASQNRFLLEKSGQASQKSIVDAIKAGDIQGVTDSTMAGRSKAYASLGGETGYTAWMKERGMI
tara:strand:+ start:183 stop:1157 length:975 start_codon:yes stop_codon:yes gene_type:complete